MFFNVVRVSWLLKCWRISKFTHNYTYNFTCVFIMPNKKYIDNDMKNLPNNENENLG